VVRIGDIAEARTLAREYRRHEAERVSADVYVGSLRDQTIHGRGDGSGFEVDLDALRAADDELAVLQDDLVAQLRDSVALLDDLQDGRGPVAGPMRRLFNSRADVETGVQGMLADYLDELISVRMAIKDTLIAYSTSDDELAGELVSAGEGGE